MHRQDGKWLTTFVGLQIVEWQVCRYRIAVCFTLFFKHAIIFINFYSALSSLEK